MLTFRARVYRKWITDTHQFISRLRKKHVNKYGTEIACSVSSGNILVSFFLCKFMDLPYGCKTKEPKQYFSNADRTASSRGWLSKWTRTSLDDGARRTNTKYGQIRTESRLFCAPSSLNMHWRTRSWFAKTHQLMSFNKLCQLSYSGLKGGTWLQSKFTCGHFNSWLHIIQHWNNRYGLLS